MIQSITLRNFQAHKKLRLDLSHPITTIIGKSDQGKSAILRALKWVCLNQPSGTAFLHHGAKDVVVELELDDKTIKRSAGTSNEYHLDEKEYKAFGREVPPDIAKLAQVSDINFQGQHEAPFWFSLSTSEVSRQLNQIVNLELIDETMSRINSIIRKGRVITDERRERLEAAKKERKRLRFVTTMNSDLKDLLETEREHEDLANQVEQLDASISQISSLSESLIDLRQVKQGSEEVLRLGKKTIDLSKERDELGRLISQIEELDAIVQTPVPKLDKLENSAKQAYFLASGAGVLGTFIGSISTLENQIEVWKEELEEAEAELITLTKGRCPLCGNPIKS